MNKHYSKTKIINNNENINPYNSDYRIFVCAQNIRNCDSTKNNEFVCFSSYHNFVVPISSGNTVFSASESEIYFLV